ncbi:MAG: methyltransferase [Massilia sp.]|nr:methyltransferase [Massilia sp.]
MRTAGLFAGIGGIELGLHAAGHETELFCEILPSAGAVLRSRWPGLPIHLDVTTLRSLPESVDLISAGFPCQDLSQAGTTAGLDGLRSGLVTEVFRLAKGCAGRRRNLLLENVPFMLQLKGGDAMRRVIAALEELKYRWAWRVVDTFGFGLPQRRERVYLVASAHFDPADVLLCDEAPLERPKTTISQRAHGFYWTEGRGGLGWAHDAVPTLKNGSTIGIASPPAVLLPDGRIIKPDIRDAERLQGLAENWTLPAEEVVRAGFRWSLVGNAVSVPVAAWLGRRLTEQGRYDTARDRSFPTEGKLPRAARYDGHTRHSVAIGSDPLGIAPPSLATFLRYPGEPLSVRATAGFLSRTRQAKLTFEPGFIEAVEKHLERVQGQAPDYSAEKRVA